MTKSVQRILLLAAVILLLALGMTACASTSPEPAPTQECPECPDCPTCPTCPEPEPCPEAETVTVPFEEQWAESGHNDAEAEAFVHWNGDDPAVVPTRCAKCHSTFGMLDFLGADGTEAGVVDNDAPIGATITCIACHNEVATELDAVTFPSGVTVENLGPEAICMQCHQGRAWKGTVDDALIEVGVTDDDTVNEELGFVNIHYFPAAATLYGNVAKGGYEYDGKTYDAKHDHVAGYDTCIGCHNQHTLEIRVEECQVCHTDVTDVESLKNIRMASSLVDYDGDGDTEEGVYYEIEGLREMLYTAIQAYANEVSGTPIVYNEATHPYFFIDANADGLPDDGDVDAYIAWTGRLLKAAYNYQMATKDPGKFAHGGKYTLELLYDSIESLNEAISTPVDLSATSRSDAGHFDGSEEAFRHWDGEEDGGVVPGTCSRCHSGFGLPQYIENGVNTNLPATNGLLCATCHNDLTTFTRYEVEDATFPSGVTVSLPDPDANLCITCHQGRESKASVDRVIADKDPDTVDEELRFINIHYFAAGATLFGTEVQGIYEIDGQEYLGRNTHVEGFDTCVECHDVHALAVNEAACFGCHQVQSLEELRAPSDNTDYDGDGEVEGLYGEIDTLRAALLTTLQEYVAGVDGAQPIAYSSTAYPYWFIDANGNGEVDEDEADRYSTFTPNSLIGAYNYQYSQKDPGAFAHNGLYVIQALIDTIDLLGGNVAAYTRP